MSSHPSRSAPATHNSSNDGTHHVVIHNGNTGQDESHRVVVDHRPAPVISHDAHVRVMVRHADWHPVHNWDHFHPVILGGYRYAWWGIWGIESWDTVGTVTCQASNENTGELYPVTMERDAAGWDDASVNNILDQALDDCMAEATVPDGGVNPCIAATPACTFESWDGRVYRPN